MVNGGNRKEEGDSNNLVSSRMWSGVGEAEATCLRRPDERGKL